MFVLGSILGIFVVGKALGINARVRAVDEIVISSARAIIGGVLLTCGGRVVRCCTSGHGIFGMSFLSVSSFVSVVAMSAGGIGLAALLKLARSQQ